MSRQESIQRQVDADWAAGRKTDVDRMSANDRNEALSRRKFLEDQQAAQRRADEEREKNSGKKSGGWFW